MIPTVAQPTSPAPAAAAPAPANRRSRLRLRDLCDEVLASYRVARERELFSEADRRDAQTVLAGFTPQTR
jgi:hypothetical protein